MAVALADEPERERTLAFLNGEITRENEQLLNGAQGTDAKGTFVAGVAAAAIPFLLANRRGLLWAGALVLYGLGFVLAVASLWPRRWIGVVPAALHRRLSGANPSFAIGHVMGAKVLAFEANYRKARQKARAWVASVLILGGGTLLAVVSTLFESRHRG